MKGKKLIMLAMAIVLLLAVPAVVFAAGKKAKAEATPPTKISATFEFKVLSPTELEITGEAKGLSPGKNYHSAVYGKDSTDTGISSCLPAKSVGGSMFAGNWGTVNNIGEASLLHISTAKLNRIETISVRSNPVGDFPNVVLVCGKVK